MEEQNNNNKTQTNHQIAPRVSKNKWHMYQLIVLLLFTKHWVYYSWCAWYKMWYMWAISFLWLWEKKQQTPTKQTKNEQKQLKDGWVSLCWCIQKGRSHKGRRNNAAGTESSIFSPEEAEKESRKWGKAMNSQILLLVTYFYQ